jgi:predicted transcriptional regulator
MNKMSKSEVYSWRLTPALKARLEAQARAEELPVSALLERVIEDWLKRRQPPDDEAEQQRMRAAAIAAAGKYKGPAVSATNERVRQVMGEQLMKKWRAGQRRAPRRSD